jgi:hypothetical protein
MSWINNMLQPSGAEWWPQTGAADLPPFAAGGASGNASGAYGGADGYQPSWWGSPFSSGSSAATGAASPTTNGMLAQIVALLQQLTGSLGSAFGGNASAATPSNAPFAPAGYGTPPGSATFANATLSSTGDPHLALTGTLDGPNGTTSPVNAHYDDMNAQRDLLSTGDFGDGFRVSTTASTPNGNGVTYNATATASMDRGRDSVTMGPGGAVSVTSDGSAVSLAAGQSITLGGGEVVSENANGAVSIAEQNARGETLTTTFAYNGSGVDVTANAAGNVTLGGSLVRHAVTGA